MTTAGSNTFGFDQANRVYTATVSSLVSSYRYDGDGKRVSRTVGANPPVNYVYDTNGSLPMVLTDGSLTYVYGLGLAYTVDITGTLQVMHTDGLGSVRAITDSSGNLIQTFQTDEFGNPALVQGTNTEPFRYTGQQNDVETGFYDLRARYYAPGIGRFVSRDRVFGNLGNPASLNRYSYATNDPMTYHLNNSG